MAEKLQLRPMVGYVHWATTAGAAWAYDTKARQQQWSSFAMLHNLSSAVRVCTSSTRSIR